MKSTLALAAGLLLLAAAGGAAAQRSGEVTLVGEKSAWQKTPILVDLPDVLSGGAAAVRTADLVQDVLESDLRLSGLFLPAFRVEAGRFDHLPVRARGHRRGLPARRRGRPARTRRRPSA